MGRKGVNVTIKELTSDLARFRDLSISVGSFTADSWTEPMGPTPFPSLTTFRNWDIAESWSGFSEQPQYENAAEIASTLVDTFMKGAGDDDDQQSDDDQGVDELHVVYSEFKSMMSQVAAALRIAPLVVEYVEEAPVLHTLYSFEPDATTLFESLLPRYVTTRVYAALLESAASELASRQRAMKSATDNADDLIKELTLMANRERQAQITQEISEIVGGANALADANAG